MRMFCAFLLLVSLTVSAGAKEVARYTASDSAALSLTDVQDGCPDGTNRFFYIGPARPKPVPGCWFELHDHIWLWDVEGEVHGAGREVFKWAIDSKDSI